MRILVAFASRHGATQGIAERIAETLRTAGHEAEATPVGHVGDASAYDAFVIGSAVYMFHWLKDATKFVRRHKQLLSRRPLWLFSSGPLGTEVTDEKGNDVVEASRAKETAEFEETVHPRDHAVFFGAWAGGKPVGLAERFVAMMPAARDAMPVGDYRDWPAIEAWAAGIAQEIQGMAAQDGGTDS